MQHYVKMMATLAPCDPGLGVNACEGQESSHPIPPRPSPGLCRASFSALHLLGGAGGSELLRGAQRGRGGSLWQPGPSAVRLHWLLNLILGRHFSQARPTGTSGRAFTSTVGFSSLSSGPKYMVKVFYKVLWRLLAVKQWFGSACVFGYCKLLLSDPELILSFCWLIYYRMAWSDLLLVLPVTWWKGALCL